MFSLFFFCFLPAKVKETYLIRSVAGVNLINYVYACACVYVSVCIWHFTLIISKKRKKFFSSDFFSAAFTS